LKDTITLRHVLSMTPGFDWNELSTPLFSPANDNIAAYDSNNYIAYGLRKDVVTTPGSAWTYNSACPMFLAGIVKNQTGVHTDEYDDEYLFGLLGITNVVWQLSDAATSDNASWTLMTDYILPAL